jgi:sec-independent protein translocase protein TatA
MLSPTHIFILLLLILLALVVFGPKRLPEIGSSLGRALQEFRKASEATVDEVGALTGVANHPVKNGETTPEAEKVPAAVPAAETKPPD